MIGDRITKESRTLLAQHLAVQSTADFVHKLEIALKEARETRYWLRLLIAVGVSEIREGISSEVSFQIISSPLFPHFPISPSPHLPTLFFAHPPLQYVPIFRHSRSVTHL